MILRRDFLFRDIPDAVRCPHSENLFSPDQWKWGDAFGVTTRAPMVRYVTLYVRVLQADSVRASLVPDRGFPGARRALWQTYISENFASAHDMPQLGYARSSDVLLVDDGLSAASRWRPGCR